MSDLRKCPSCNTMCHPEGKDAPKCFIDNRGGVTMIACSSCEKTNPTGLWKKVNVTTKQKKKFVAPTNLLHEAIKEQLNKGEQS